MSGPGPELNALAERYVAAWNEPDAVVRRRLVEELWVPEGANFTKGNEWHGYESLEARVRGAHEKWVRDGGCLFRTRSADSHHDAARIVWEMVSIANGQVVSIGQEFLLLDGNGKIREDFQFIEPDA